MRSAEHDRLEAHRKRLADWQDWGPYVSDRAWGTVREDFSSEEDPWSHFTHDDARSRAFRWNEDGIAGFCNRFQNACLALALWNEHDPFLKERLFGLAGPEGNHGEDVKEYYFHLDATPTHSYMKMLYKYPQGPFPYGELVEQNRRRGRHEPEFELIDALGDAFAAGHYFDVTIEYAKRDEQDLLCRITAVNRAERPAPLQLLPHVWFRNSWSWGKSGDRPQLRDRSQGGSVAALELEHKHLDRRFWYARDRTGSAPRVLVTDNETNHQRIFGRPNASPWVKDGIDRAVVAGESHAVNPDGVGTKAAAQFRRELEAGERWTIEVRFAPEALDAPFDGFDATFDRRIEEADAFHAAIAPEGLDDERSRVHRQALAGLMWTKQFYHYSVELWQRGDGTGMTSPPPTRSRNGSWKHLYNLDVISMPDKWEYPWYAAWDLAFHTLPIALIDPTWAKRQLTLLCREWYQHPNGQLPAYEWSFSDVNPPVHAWAALRVFQLERERTGHADYDFLASIFHKLLLNFTWWVNRKDQADNNIFEGGFLGLDNIGIFDRSHPLPDGGYLEQSDGTAWMGMYCLNMLSIALELARERPSYEDVASKFFEHFVWIAGAINGPDGLWDEADGFFYDKLHPGRGREPELIRVRSLVGLASMFAVATLDPELLERLPRFRRRMEWFIRYRPDWVSRMASLTREGADGRRLLSLVPVDRLRRLLSRLLDPDQFLSPFGIRSLSKEYDARPFTMRLGQQELRVGYEPAESSSGMFGGNSNWRGPVWFPVNYLMIESLRTYRRYHGPGLEVEYPIGSGNSGCLDAVAHELSERLIRLFLTDTEGRRPFYGGVDLFQRDPQWREHTLFYEYFHGDNGAGIGASHQTGWTSLVANLIDECARR